MGSPKIGKSDIIIFYSMILREKLNSYMKISPSTESDWTIDIEKWFKFILILPKSITLISFLSRLISSSYGQIILLKGLVWKILLPFKSKTCKLLQSMKANNSMLSICSCYSLIFFRCLKCILVMLFWIWHHNLDLFILNPRVHVYVSLILRSACLKI